MVFNPDSKKTFKNFGKYNLGAYFQNSFQDIFEMFILGSCSRENIHCELRKGWSKFPMELFPCSFCKKLLCFSVNGKHMCLSFPIICSYFTQFWLTRATAHLAVTCFELYCRLYFRQPIYDAHKVSIPLS